MYSGIPELINKTRKVIDRSLEYAVLVIDPVTPMSGGEIPSNALEGGGMRD